MSDGETKVPLHPEFNSALEKLHRLFARALWDVKQRTCFTASSEVKRAKSAKKKVEIVSRQFEHWKEGSVNTIREWLPKFAQLAAAHPEAIHGELIQWTRDSVWKIVEGQCGIGPLRGGNWSHDQVNPVTIYWFAVASEGNVGVNLPPIKLWCAPRWLAADRKETNVLLEKHTGNLWIVLSHVIEEALDLVEIQRAISRSDVTIPAAGSGQNVNQSLETDSGAWRDVENRFRNLEREGGKELSAGWHSTARPEIGQHWYLRGTDRLLRQRFERIAQGAALKLGHTDVSTGLFFWLDLLKRDTASFQIGLQRLSIRDSSLVHSEGGIIQSICAASAAYCLKLENDEVAQSMKERPSISTQPELQTRTNNPSFYTKNASYQKVVFRECEYSLTPQAGAIVRILHEAEGSTVAKADIQSKTKCGKISDSFRSLDGRQVWKKLIEVTKGRKGFYRLRAEAFGDSQAKLGRTPSTAVTPFAPQRP